MVHRTTHPPNAPYPGWYNDAITILGALQLFVGGLMITVEILLDPIRTLRDMLRSDVRRLCGEVVRHARNNG